MRLSELSWYRLRWPREVEIDRLQAMSLLLATTAGAPVVVEANARAGVIEHRLGVPRAHANMVDQIRIVVPGIALTALEREAWFEGGMAFEVRLTSSHRSLRIEQSALTSRALLTALGHTRHGEEVVLQWQLLTALPPQPVGSGAEHAEALPMSVGDILLGRRVRLDGEARSALRTKRALHVWRAVGRAAVKAATPAREKMLLRELFMALRLADAPGVSVVARRCSPARLTRPARSWFAPLRLNTAELVAVSGWPTGVTTELPVERSETRPLAPRKAVPHDGRVLARSTFPGAERPIALSATDGLRHLHVLGPTGTGKSTLLLNLITQDVAAGRAVVVIEPKGDLIHEVLERIPPSRLDDVVLLDPAEIEQPIGLNPLAGNGRPPELVADELLAMFRNMYASSWGPRTNDILGASLLTLARTPGMTLCALPVLLIDAAFRHRIVSALDDPVGLEPFWVAYEHWSEAERLAAIAPSMNRIRPFLMRPQLRAMLGQSQPRFDLAQVFVERKVLLVNLAKGAIGGEAAALLGSLLLGQLWAAALRRATLPPDRRHPAFVYVDEVQDYLRLPTDVGDALVQARGLGVGFVLAHQHLSQLDPAVRSAVLTNARSRVCFQLAAEDARTLASGSVTADDFRELPAFEVYAQLVADGAVQPWCSARTRPPSTVISSVDKVRRRSRQRYGVDRLVVDSEIERLLGGAPVGANDIAPRRRDGRGAA
jgi:hypothetical protein